MPELVSEVVDEIVAHGPMPFGRFVELALYDPAQGFYARGGAGRRGDFITSPEVGPLFGALVARAMDSWWRELGEPEEFVFVEMGAGPGTLARSVLRSPLACAPALHYVAVEASDGQRGRHPAGVDSRARPPDRVAAGVVFANELLDNLPFDVLDFTPGIGWREVRVAEREGALVEELVDVAPGRELPPVPARACRMPDQHAARNWVRDAAARMTQGRIVAIDYMVEGYPVADDRPWLRTYRGHERGGHPLDSPGSQDITVDIDLEQLRAARPPESVTSQATWLRDLGIDELVDEGRRRWLDAAAAPDLAALEGRSRVREAEALLDPAGLGGFTVVEWQVT